MKSNSTRGLRTWQKAVILILLVCAGFIFTLIVVKPSGKKDSVSSNLKTAKVKKISLKQTLLVSGTVQSSNTKNVISKVSGNLEKVFVKNGQNVKKGDLIARIDKTQAVYKIESLKRQLAELELQKKKLDEQSQNVVLKSPLSGFVQNIAVAEGMFVTQGTQVMTIVDDSKMKLDCEFPAWCYAKINKGQKVEIVTSDFAGIFTGIVESKGERIYKNQDGLFVFGVKVILPKRDVKLPEGVKASVKLRLSDGEEVVSVGEGVLDYYLKKNVISPISGRIERVFVADEQKVAQGDLLLKFSEDDITTQLKQIGLKIEDIKTQINLAEDELKNYTILSPIDGKIADFNLQEGDLITAGQMICSVYDPQHLVMNSLVEEFDISKIKPGQKAYIKVDAAANSNNSQTEGYVKEIADKAQVDSTDVAKYLIKIAFYNSSNIKIGMRAEAEILLKYKKDALVVPVEAIHKENGKHFVYVYTAQKSNASKKIKSSKESKKTDEYGLDISYYKDAEKRWVTVGIVTDKYAEVLKGLKEGEEVILPRFDGQSEGRTLFY